MKRFLSLVFLSLFAANSFAQKPVYQTGHFAAPLQGKTATDTLWPGNAPAASDYVLIADSMGGYVLGTNSYHSIAIGQQFPVTTSYKIEAALFWFGTKKVTTNDSITFAVWRMDSLNAYTTSGDYQPGPGTELTRYRTTLDQVDTASSLDNAFFVTFDHPVIVIDDYVMGFDFSGFVNDSIGLVSTANGDGLGSEHVWEKWSINQTWHTLQASGWGFPAVLDVDAMILPIVDMTQAGLQSAPAINGLRCELFPNPVHDMLHLRITSATALNNCNINIFDISGKLIMTEAFEIPATLEYSLSLNLNHAAPGAYYCVLTSGNGKYAMKFNIE